MARDGAIDVQVPSATSRRPRGVGHDLRVRPRSPEWTAWPDGARGSVPRVRDGPSSLLTPAQLQPGEGDPSRGQRICLRFALRLGPRRCSHTTGERGRGSDGAGDSVQGHQAGEGPDARMDSPAPPRDLPLQHEAANEPQRMTTPTATTQPKEARTGCTSGRPRRHPRQGPGGTEAGWPAVASGGVLPIRAQRGGASTLPCWADAGSSGRGTHHSARR